MCQISVYERLHASPDLRVAKTPVADSACGSFNMISTRATCPVCCLLHDGNLPKKRVYSSKNPHACVSHDARLGAFVVLSKPPLKPRYSADTWVLALGVFNLFDLIF